MSVQAMADCWAQSPFREPPQHAKFLVHLAIADVVNDVHENKLWMLREELAAKSMSSLRSVSSVLSELVELGWLTVLEPGGGRRKATLYQYALSTSLNRATVATFPDETVQSDARNRATRGTSSTSIPIEHNAHLFDAAAIADEFETWWQQYPRKVDKAKARRKYNARRIEGVTAAALLRARDAYAASVVDTDVKYIKHGATFLGKGPDAPWTEWIDGDPAADLDDPGSITSQLGRQQWGRT